MKSLLTLLTILFSLFSNAQPTWNVVSMFPEQGLATISVPDSMHIRGISYWPWQFIYSDDGGSNWNVIPLNDTLLNVDFSDAMHGWASSFHGKMLHTHDGGQTWSTSQINTLQYFDLMQFINDSVGFVFTGQTDSLFVTHDAGISWNYYKTNFPWGPTPKKVFFKDELNGWYFSGADTSLFHTTNGGAFWNVESLPSPVGGYGNNGISFVDSLTGFLIGKSALMKTIDGGITWSIVNNLNGGDIAFRDSLDGIRIDGNENIYHTFDGGINWMLGYSAPLHFSNLNPPHCFLADNLFFEFNQHGALLKSTDGITWKNISWNSFPNSLGNGAPAKLFMSSPANGMFIGATDCTNNSCGNETFFTNDSGRTWQQSANLYWNTAGQASSDSAWYFTQTFFPVDSCTIYKSNNGLQSYLPFAAFNDRIYHISFNDSIHLIAFGDSLHYSSDGGATWTTTIGTSTLRHACFIDTQHGWATSAYTVAKTNDYGLSWNVIYTEPTMTYLYDKIQFTDSLHGFIVNSYYNKINISSDGGYNWITMSCPNYVNDLFMADSLKGWIATDDGIYFTDDGFQTFQLQYNKPIAGFSFNDKSHGYAFGYNILLSTDQTGLINDVSSLHSNNIENLNIFPNPCNAKTELILDGSLTKVILSDLNGKILYCISTTDKRVTINTESLIPGIYLISAKNDRATFNKKLVVAR